MQNITLYSQVDIYCHVGGISQALRKRYEHTERRYRSGKLSEAASIR
jgi:hypothetical protein